MSKNKKRVFIISILIIIEQVIKIIINNKFLSSKFPIIPGLVYFSPLFNRDYSWINNLFDLGISKFFHIIMVIFIIIIIYLFYKYAFNSIDTPAFNISYTLIMSGAICSLIDKVFWDGSLDYIYLKNLFTFDLKDAYISLFVVTVVYMAFFDESFIAFVEDENLMHNIKNYYKN